MAHMYDLVGAEDIIGTQFGDTGALNVFSGHDDMSGDHDLHALLAGAGVPIVGTQFGAVPIVGRRHPKNHNRQAMLRQLASRQARAVVPRPVTKGREYPLGFGPTTITAGSSAIIITQPQVPFKGRRLIIPSDFAGAILINDIKVGKNSQLATSNSLPGRMFTEFAVGVDLGLDTAQISQQVTLNVTNISGATVNFSASLTGAAVE
jgi:hypothetical protein